MIWYLSREEVPDVENPSPEVLRYLVEKAEAAAVRYRRLERYYRGEHPALMQRSGPEEVRVAVNYAKYVVDTALGYYLGEGVKYDSNERSEGGVFGGQRVQLRSGRRGRKLELSPLLECYDRGNIPQVDLELGRDMGIYGEALELCYLSSEEVPCPKSARIHPASGILVCDDTVEHNKLFGLVWEQRETVTGERYYAVTVYTERSEKEYRSGDLKTAVFHQIGQEREHFWGEVPLIAYRNNGEGQGDFEQIISLIDAYNDLMSSRLTDKRKFVDALLVFFGMSLREGDENRLAREKFLDGAPLDARAEYIQKTFDESGVQVLADALVREMHKMTLTVDMSDEKFSGNSSGQALKLKLLTMNLLVKSKMRQMERGLKERFRMVNRVLVAMGCMEEVSTHDVDVVFTVSMPMDEGEIVERVTKLQGIVDDRTLLSQLWFVRDPSEALSNIRTQRKEEKNGRDEGEGT